MKHNKAGLSAWQLTMLALGTVVGGSFFLGSAIAINTAGPAVLIAYILGGILVYFILFALSEMTVADPTPGSFRTFSERAFGPGVGFVVGWVYWTGLILAMSSEATAVSLFFRVWFPRISLPLLGSMVIIGVTLLNLLGSDRLSKLESGLAAIKLLAIIGFILLAIFLVSGLMPNKPTVGIGSLVNEPLFPAGISGIAGSMLIVMFTYAGFEIIGLAASETKNPHGTVPKAITYTVIGLVGLYTVAITLLLPLIPTSAVIEEVSPFVSALELYGIDWAVNAINLVLVTAILSTMLAATFGLGRMIRSLAEEGYAPSWLRDRGDIPYRGIIFSGISMLLALSLGLLLPLRIYIFLVSSGGFSLLFTYLIIMATHYKFRKKHGCPPKGHCQFPGYPYTSWIIIAALIITIATMPLIPGQGSGLVAGIVLLIFYSICYMVTKHIKNTSNIKKPLDNFRNIKIKRKKKIK
ncbi:amino acid permease [Clostridium ganghwense]|uniref:Amino acid permease n=1 Tax=Clostridium ganghwense TaxID=312089 RepID=A0ABT4CKD0_9CLOT|nr:amino acid permease [Clostridium ganghwense]MCY6369497.1 amino acid permease [Clostridium ganghwense]